MSDHIILRSAQVDDVGNIASLFWNGAAPNHWQASVRTSIATYPSVVADLEGQLAGFAYSDEYDQDTLMLENIHVAKQYRNRRIGSYLLSHIERAAAERYSEIILFNSDPEKQRTPDLPSATRFYLQRGYQRRLANSAVQAFTKSLR